MSAEEAINSTMPNSSVRWGRNVESETIEFILGGLPDEVAPG